MAALASTVSFAQSSSANQPGTPESAVEQEANRLAPIKSERDPYEHLISASDSPLHRLPTWIKWEFIGSLVFTDKELGGYRYDLLALLAPADRGQLLALFGIPDTAFMLDRADSESDAEQAAAGIDSTSARDYLFDYECFSRATCKAKHG